MPSEKQIEAAMDATHGNIPVMLLVRALTAAEQAESATDCIACEGKPAHRNNPCKVCGREVKPATDAEPFTHFYRYSDPMTGGAIWRSSSGLWNGQRPSETLPLYSRPPESRLREALEGLLEVHEALGAGNSYAAKKARAALAQEDGRNE